MVLFKYTAIDKNGKNVKGQIEAENHAEAVTKVKGLGFYPTNIDLYKESQLKKILSFKHAGESSFLSNFISNIKLKEITIFSRQLATLIDAGLPLVKSLFILGKQQKNPKLKIVIENIGNQVESGSSFSDALGKHTKLFSKLFVSTIRAGETGGILDIVLNRLADYREKNDRLRRKIKGAMAYPAVVLAITLIVLVLLVTIFVPQFMTFFDEFGADLPLPTVMVVAFSNSVVKFWYFYLIFPVVAAFIIRMFLQKPKFRFMWDSYKFKMPIFGELLLKYTIARFTRTLGTLLASGIPILQALEITKETLENIYIEKALQTVYDTVREGETVAAPLERTGVFPDMITSMIGVGEETGALDGMLIKIADIFDDEVDTAVSSLTSILEPILIVFLAIVVGGIVISMFLPLITLITQLTM